MRAIVRIAFNIADLLVSVVRRSSYLRPAGTIFNKAASLIDRGGSGIYNMQNV
jgi:hypothetical protein